MVKKQKVHHLLQAMCVKLQAFSARSTSAVWGGISEHDGKVRGETDEQENLSPLQGQGITKAIIESHS